MKISLMILDAVGNTFDELIEFYRKHGGGFVEDVKSVAFRKPTLIEITNLTLL
jgi:hypothetical protein